MITACQLEFGVKKYGTPMYVFDLDEARKTISDVKKKTEGIADICFAMKANPFIAGYLSEFADRIEVCSMGEYEICRAMQIKPEKLLISGVVKEKKDLDKILSECCGACIYTVESMNQFYYFAEWSKEHDVRLRLYLRLSSGNQFGMDERTVEDLISIRKVCSMIDIIGLHYFSGTMKKSSKTVEDELKRLDCFIQKIEKNYGFEFKDLEYGPGLAVPYFEGQTNNRNEDLKRLNHSIREMTWKGRVILEMGRFLVADAGYYLTGVQDLKVNDDTGYCLVDGGIHQVNYDGQIRGLYQPHIQICPDKISGEEREWIICGSLCTVNDILAQKVRLREIRVGDTLVFMRTGAYAMTEGMSLFLSHSLPKVAFYSNKSGWELIRSDQPTYPLNMKGVREWKNC